jgi:hypothetical protein
MKPPNVKNSTDLIENSQKSLSELTARNTISGFDRINNAFAQVTHLKGIVAEDRYFCEGL